MDDILQKAAERLSLPADVVAGAPRVEIIGCRQVFIENHRGVLEYGNELIDVNGGKVTVRIQGDELSLKAMNKNELLIGGNILSVSFKY